MHETNWATAQKKDLVLNAVLSWLGTHKKTDLRTLLGEHACSEERWMVWKNCQNFTTLQNALYLCSMPKGQNEDLLLFMVPKPHWIAALNGCHWDTRHQGHDHNLSLLQEHFGGQEWPNRWDNLLGPVHTASNMRVASPRPRYAPLWLRPLDLLHVDFTSIETTLEPNQSPRVANVLEFQDHFMKHVLAYVTLDSNCENHC